MAKWKKATLKADGARGKLTHKAAAFSIAWTVCLRPACPGCGAITSMFEKEAARPCKVCSLTTGADKRPLLFAVLGSHSKSRLYEKLSGKAVTCGPRSL